MAPWSFDMKFPHGTQFTFRSLTFAAGEDGDLKMLPPGPAPEVPTPAPSAASGGACSCSDPFAGIYIRSCHIPKFSFRNVNHFSHKKLKISKRIHLI
jgi:hypothetical protein